MVTTFVEFIFGEKLHRNIVETRGKRGYHSLGSFPKVKPKPFIEISQHKNRKLFNYINYLVLVLF